MLSVQVKMYFAKAQLRPYFSVTAPFDQSLTKSKISGASRGAQNMTVNVLRPSSCEYHILKQIQMEQQ